MTVSIAISGCQERKNVNLMSVIILFAKLRRNEFNHGAMDVLMAGSDHALDGAHV